MANTSIRIKKSATTGISPVSLAYGEIAINTADGKLFYSNPSNTIKFIENQLTFGTINVNSQLVQATTSTDILSLVSGNNVDLAVDSINKKITIGVSNAANVSSSVGATFVGPIVANTLTSNTSVSIGGNSVITSSSFTTSSTSEVVFDSFPAANFRSAKYEVQLTSGSNYHVIELRIVHNNTNVWMVQYGEMYTNTPLGNFDSSITSGILKLLLTPTNAITTVKFNRSALTV